jgi:hypothetical protein
MMCEIERQRWDRRVPQRLSVRRGSQRNVAGLKVGVAPQYPPQHRTVVEEGFAPLRDLQAIGSGTFRWGQALRELRKIDVAIAFDRPDVYFVAPERLKWHG